MRLSVRHQGLIRIVSSGNLVFVQRIRPVFGFFMVPWDNGVVATLH